MFSYKRFVLFAVVAFVAFGVTYAAYASHAWGNYHWARTANPFTVKLGDNVSTLWDNYLSTTSNDWSASDALDTLVVSGGTKPKNCRPTAGRAEVCSERYGFTGWLGVAQIWANGNHITQGTVKVNDSYFNTTTYNTPAWRNLVMCQEVGHIFGLDHQDENFTNPNLGTCMDYTNNPSGPLSNEHPNAHDYEELDIIYSHLDSFATISQSVTRGNSNVSVETPREWGKILRTTSDGKSSVYVRDLGSGEKVFTFVVWAK